MFVTGPEKFFACFLALFFGGCIFLLVLGLMLANAMGKNPNISLFG